MLLIKSICPICTHPLLKKKWGTPKRNAAKCYIMCTFQDVKPTQETAGSGLNRLYNVLCLLWNIHSGAPLPRIYSITNTKHWITYMYISKFSCLTAENTDQAACVHWSLVRNYTACSKMIFDKTAWSNGTWIYKLSECLHCLRIRVECTNNEDWLAYTTCIGSTVTRW